MRVKVRSKRLNRILAAWVKAQAVSNVKLGESEFDSRYRWNPALGSTGRYIDRNGRAVSSRVIVSQLERVIEGVKGEMIKNAEDLAAGRISAQIWYNRMGESVRIIHGVTASASAGGWAQMGERDWAIVNEQVKAQSGFLNRFGTQVDRGEVKFTKGFFNRVASYADAARSTGEDIRRRAAVTSRSATHEQRVLGDADHCRTDARTGLKGCVDLAGFWAAVGSLPPIGQTPCGNNCHCHFIFGIKVGNDIVALPLQ